MRIIIVALTLFALAACGGPVPATGPGGTQIYRISSRDAQQIPLRIEESVNSLRQASGAAPVRLNPALSQAAAQQSQDLARQNRPWWFGSDASTPLDRAARAGYGGQLLGEIGRETFQTEGEALAAWMRDPGTRSVILDPRARDLGFGWVQEQGGKIWWTLTTGAPRAAPLATASADVVGDTG